MKKNTWLLLFLPAIVTALFGFVYDDGGLTALLARLEKFSGMAPQEKVHLQTDKPYYSLGEDIWFKAYVVDAHENLLTDRSKILYVDLVDDKDSVRQSLVLPIENGLTSGNLHLDDSLLTSGNYRLCAYTRWMQNFDNDLIFKKAIPVVNALRGAVTGRIAYQIAGDGGNRRIKASISYVTGANEPFIKKAVTYTLYAGNKEVTSGKGVTDADGKLIISTTVKAPGTIVINTVATADKGRPVMQDFVVKPLASVADVQFFPEGGHLVTGIRTKVGFKAIKPDGLSEEISGYVTEDGGNEHIAELASDHADMGVFALLPAVGKSYTAVIKHADGSEQRYALPKADASGYVLNVNHVGDSVSVRISVTPDLVNGRDCALIAQCNGAVQFAAQIKMNKASNVSRISASKFRTGITQFTLFNPGSEPVAERLVFFDHNNELNADLKSDKPEYTRRGKVNISLDVKDNHGQPVVGSFSVAVIDGGKVKTNEDSETSILSNLLLTSDIKGYVEQPNYYFNPANANRQKHLDELLLTQGWRRFSWADLQKDKFPEIKYEFEQSPTVTGSIITLGGKPVPRGKVTLVASINGQPYIKDTVADDRGKFIFKDLYFADTTRVAVRATDAKDSRNVKILFDKIPVMRYHNTGALDAAIINQDVNNYLAATQAQFIELSKAGLFKNVIALKEVSIKAKKNWNADRIIPNSMNLNAGSADWVIKAEKLQNEPNLLFGLGGISGIYIKNDIIYRAGHTTRLQEQGSRLPVASGVQKRTIAQAPGDDSGLVDADNTHPMALFVDGARMNPAFIKDIPAADVAGVEILTSTSNLSVYGDEGYWGMIIVTTKRGGEVVDNLPRLNVGHFKTKGYTSSKEFYSPAYDTPGQTIAADLRSTIYWNPNIVTDAQGHASFGYFNADGTGTYKVTLEGMDTKGGLLRKVYTYVVK